MARTSIHVLICTSTLLSLHLHFHICDGKSLSDSEGLPFVFESFDILGETRLLEAIGLESSIVE
jgi:hypothetical protein